MENTIFFNDYVAEQIRHRYAETSVYGVDNNIIRKLHEHVSIFAGINQNFENLYNPNLLFLHPSLWKTGVRFYQKHAYNFIPRYTYNPEFKKLAKRSVGIDDIVDDINDIPYFHSRELYQMLKSIKKEKMNLVVIGYGGAMANFLWNLSVIAKYLSITNLFKQITIYEKETLTFTNLLRIGKPIAWLTKERELEYITALSQGAEDVPAFIPDKFTKPQLIVTEETLLAHDFRIVNRYLTQNDIDASGKTIYIGAPNFETRNMLHGAGVPFFMIGHSDNRVQISKTPYVLNNGLTTETYGKIKIPELLMNLQLATTTFIKILSAGYDEVNELPHDTVLWTHDFDEENGEEAQEQEEEQEAYTE